MIWKILPKDQQNFLDMSLLEFLGFENSEDNPCNYKICTTCKTKKHILEYNTDITRMDKRASICKICRKAESKIRLRIKKYAPPKISFCECCGKSTKKIFLDHDHETETFRGWLCEPCNTGLGKFGDTLEGIEMARNYLLKYKERIINGTEN